MKNVAGLCITVIILLCQTFAAASEDMIQYDPMIPESTFIITSDPIRAYMLSATEYVSSDEIWFCGTADEGGPWIIKANMHGEILWQERVPILNQDDRIEVCAMSKTPNGLLLGILDHKTTLGSVALLSENGQFHQTSLGNAKIFSFTASPLGMLAQGILYDEDAQTCAPQTTLIGLKGEIIFQKTGEPYEVAVDGGTLTASRCTSSEDLIFVVESRHVPNTFRSASELVCLDVSGHELWRVPLASEMIVETLSSADGHIYLIGFWGTWNEEGLLTNQQATIQCYSSEGICCWTQKFDTPYRFYRGDAKQGICVATGKEDDFCYMAVMNTEGHLLLAVKMEAWTQYINKPYILSEKRVITLGMAGENYLIMKDIDLKF